MYLEIDDGMKFSLDTSICHLVAEFIYLVQVWVPSMRVG